MGLPHTQLYMASRRRREVNDTTLLCARAAVEVASDALRHWVGLSGVAVRALRRGISCWTRAKQKLSYCFFFFLYIFFYSRCHRLFWRGGGASRGDLSCHTDCSGELAQVIIVYRQKKTRKIAENQCSSILARKKKQGRNIYYCTCNKRDV